MSPSRYNTAPAVSLFDGWYSSGRQVLDFSPRASLIGRHLLQEWVHWLTFSEETLKVLDGTEKAKRCAARVPIHIPDYVVGRSRYSEGVMLGLQNKHTSGDRENGLLVHKCVNTVRKEEQESKKNT